MDTMDLRVCLGGQGAQREGKEAVSVGTNRIEAGSETYHAREVTGDDTHVDDVDRAASREKEGKNVNSVERRTAKERRTSCTSPASNPPQDPTSSRKARPS
jgi:hypothetical protein